MKLKDLIPTREDKLLVRFIKAIPIVALSLLVIYFLYLIDELFPGYYIGLGIIIIISLSLWILAHYLSEKEIREEKEKSKEEYKRRMKELKKVSKFGGT